MCVVHSYLKQRQWLCNQRKLASCATLESKVAFQNHYIPASARLFDFNLRECKCKISSILAIAIEGGEEVHVTNYLKFLTDSLDRI